MVCVQSVWPRLAFHRPSVGRLVEAYLRCLIVLFRYLWYIPASYDIRERD